MPIAAIKTLDGTIKKHIENMDISKQEAFMMGVRVEDGFSTIVR